MRKTVKGHTSASSSVYPCWRPTRQERRGGPLHRPTLLSGREIEKAEDSNEREREEKRRPNITCVINIDVPVRTSLSLSYFFVFTVSSVRYLHRGDERGRRRRRRRRKVIEECAQFFNFGNYPSVRTWFYFHHFIYMYIYIYIYFSFVSLFPMECVSF